MSYLEELLPEFRKGAKIRRKCWSKEYYLYYKDGLIYNQDNRITHSFSPDSLLWDEWEFADVPEPDWQYIINHACICYFWDNGCTKCLGRLTNRMDGLFYRDNDVHYDNCCPARRDEVFFYEDERDGD